jgi:DNA-binding protein YbaB
MGAEAYMPDQRWGFEEDDEYEDTSTRRSDPRPTGEDDDQVEGTDPERIVTVVAGLDGTARAVRLMPTWAQSVDPTSLPQRVITAANAATMAALGRQLDAATPAEPAPVPPATAAGDGAAGPTGDPFAAINDILRLMDEVSGDLDTFQRQLATQTAGLISADSSGRHVSVSSRDGQIVDVSIDPRWAGAVRTSELEGELLDALRRVQRMAAPGDLAQGPHSSAISELNNLVRDPQAMLRQLGLLR